MPSNSDRFRHAAARGAGVLLCLLATEALAVEPARLLDQKPEDE